MCLDHHHPLFPESGDDSLDVHRSLRPSLLQGYVH